MMRDIRPVDQPSWRETAAGRMPALRMACRMPSPSSRLRTVGIRSRMELTVGAVLGTVHSSGWACRVILRQGVEDDRGGEGVGGEISMLYMDVGTYLL